MTSTAAQPSMMLYFTVLSFRLKNFPTNLLCRIFLKMACAFCPEKAAQVLLLGLLLLKDLCTFYADLAKLAVCLD
jgi:hypothetical protein